MKKSILFKIWKFPQISETFIVNQIILAIKLGYDVKILVGELNDIPENANNNLFEKYELRDKIIVEDFNVPTQKTKRILRASWLFFSNILLVPHLIKYYNSTNRKGLETLYEFFFYKNFREYDTIHIQFGTNKHPIDILKKIGYIKSQLIVSFHGHDLYFPINNRIPNNGYYNNLFQVADFLIANTVFLEEKLLEINAPIEKIKIIPVAVDTVTFKPALNETLCDKIRLITVGRLDELKGQAFGIKVINLLIQKGFNIEYMIVGSGLEEQNLINLIEKLELKERVFLKGKMKPDMIPEFLQNSHIFLLTSITNANGMQESQGLVTAEAQACGLPVVAFDTGGVKHTLLDGVTGFLCKEKDLQCFVEKIGALILNERLRNQMGLSARKFIMKEFSEEYVLNKWKNLYD